MCRSSQLACALLALAAVACTGVIAEPEVPNLENPEEVPLTYVIPEIDTRCVHGGNPVRSVTLSQTQLDNTVAAYLGTTRSYTMLSLPDFAERVADDRAASELAALACTPESPRPSSPADPCITDYIAKRGKQLFRRPLDTAEIDSLYRSYLDGGLRLLLATMLQSPQFLTRTEHGTPGTHGVTRLTSYELAAAIAYTTTDAPPDATLIQHADDDDLDDATIRDEVRRLLATAAGKATLTRFVTDWLATPAVLAVARDDGPITEPLARDMITETRLTVEDVLFAGSGTLDELLTVDHTFANGALADFYGFDGPSGSSFEKVSLAGHARPGVLGHGSFLAAHATPPTTIMHRGNVARTLLFCQSLPPKPSVGLPAEFKAPKLTPNPRDGETRRTQIDRESGDLAGPGTPCYSCHQYFIPLGWAFESFDDYGRSRTEDNGLPVDDSGMIVETESVDPKTGQIVGPNVDITETAFADFPEFTAALAANATVSDCVAEHIFTFAKALSTIAKNDCDVRDFQAAFADNGGNIVEAFIELMGSKYLTERVAP